jgi:hypothetical protein
MSPELPQGESEPISKSPLTSNSWQPVGGVPVGVGVAEGVDVAVGEDVGGGEPVAVGVGDGKPVGVGDGEPVGVGVGASAPMPGQKPASSRKSSPLSAPAAG